MTRRINAGEGSLGKLLQRRALAKSLTSADDEPGSADRKLSPRRRHGGKLLTDRSCTTGSIRVTERLRQADLAS